MAERKSLMLRSPRKRASRSTHGGDPARTDLPRNPAFAALAFAAALAGWQALVWATAVLPFILPGLLRVISAAQEPPVRLQHEADDQHLRRHTAAEGPRRLTTPVCRCAPSLRAQNCGRH
jgi:hypothetical protein